MIRIISLTITFIVMIFQMCFSMQFSQPIHLGEIFQTQAKKGAGGIVVKGATQNNGSYYTVYDKNNKSSYGKGVACFGSGKESIYVHYDLYKKSNNGHTIKIGDKSLINCIEVPLWEGNNIYQINTDSGMIFYCMYTGYGSIAHNFIIGKKKDNSFVKYFDTPSIEKKYFGYKNDDYIFFETVRCQENVLIIPYLHNRIRGEFRFKWDDKAEWFGVEQVVN